MNMDTHMSGSTVKNHISLKMVFEYSAIRKISYPSWFLVKKQLLQARLPQHPRLLQVRKLIIQITIQQSSQLKSVDRLAREDPYSDIPEWLHEFRENLVDERVPEHRDSHASSSHEPSLEPLRSVDFG